MELTRLDERHYGLTPAMAESLAEAASVCLARHFHSPEVVNVTDYNQTQQLQLEWSEPVDRVLRAHANETDATEDGACCVSLAVIDHLKGYVAVSRAEKLSGADYYIAPEGQNIFDLETAYRLEVSGLNNGGITDCEYRLTRKIAQTRVPGHDRPAIASVVGFRQRVVLISDVIT